MLERITRIFAFFMIMESIAIAQQSRLYFGGAEMAIPLPSSSCTLTSWQYDSTNGIGAPVWRCGLNQGVSVNITNFAFPNESGLTLKGRATLLFGLNGTGSITADQRVCFELMDHIAQKNSADTSLVLQSAYPSDNSSLKHLMSSGAGLALNRIYTVMSFSTDQSWTNYPFTVKADNPATNCGDTCDFSPIYIRVRRISCNTLCTAANTPFNGCCTGNGTGNCDIPTTVNVDLLSFGYKLSVE